MFFDLRASVQNDPAFGPHQQAQLANFLIKLGYDGVAYDVELDKLEKNDVCLLKPLPFSTEAADEKQEHDAVGRKSAEISALSSVRLELSSRPAFYQYTRLTLVVGDTTQIQLLQRNNDKISSYDIFAVCPKTEKAFISCCANADADIISLDMGGRMPFNVKPAQASQAIERGMFFEICYSPCIKDSAARKNIIRNAISLHRACRGRNIIVSSGGSNVMDLRGPYDVMNLSELFGFDSSSTKALVEKNCRSVIMKAETRRNTFKAAITVVPVCTAKTKETKAKNTAASSASVSAAAATTSISVNDSIIEEGTTANDDVMMTDDIQNSNQQASTKSKRKVPDS